MDTLIVQYGTKHSHVAELVRSSNDKLSIGRSYANDLVLTDTHIAPHQVQFDKYDGQWQVRALDHTNPVLLNGEPVTDKPVTVKSGDKILLGRTIFLLFSADHPVAETRKLIMSSWLHRNSQSLWLPFLILLFVCIADGLIDYFRLSTDLDWKTNAAVALTSSIIVSIWAGLWSLTGKLSRHHHHFSSQLIVTSLALALLTLIHPVSSYLEFMTHSTTVSMVTNYALTFITLVILLKFNLHFSTNINDTLKVSMIIMALLISVFYWFASFSKKDEFNYSPEYSRVLKPPFSQMRSGKSVDDYFLKFEKDVLVNE